MRALGRVGVRPRDFSPIAHDRNGGSFVRNARARGKRSREENIPRNILNHASDMHTIDAPPLTRRARPDCAVCEEGYASGYQFSCSSCIGEDMRAAIGKRFDRLHKPKEDSEGRTDTSMKGRAVGASAKCQIVSIRAHVVDVGQRPLV